jgi:hypothetical protein
MISDAESMTTFRKARRWTSGVIAILVGLAAVCHGCHGGDRDDELSLTGKAHTENRQDRAKVKPEGQPKAQP